MEGAIGAGISLTFKDLDQQKMKRILFNFIEIELSSDSLNVFKFKQPPKDRFRDLRKKFQGFNFAKYDGNVVFWPMFYYTDKTLSPKGNPVSIDLNKDQTL